MGLLLKRKLFGTRQLITDHLKSSASETWFFVTDVNKNHSQVAHIIHEIQSTTDFKSKIADDIQKATENLLNLVASADGLQYTNDPLQDCRNYSNVLFNIMRGGIFDDGYQVEKADFAQYIEKANIVVFENNQDFFNYLRSQTHYQVLCSKALTTQDPDLIRLTKEYLTLKFSRRHGDPSRPWIDFLSI